MSLLYDILFVKMVLLIAFQCVELLPFNYSDCRWLYTFLYDKNNFHLSYNACSPIKLCAKSSELWSIQQNDWKICSITLLLAHWKPETTKIRSKMPTMRMRNGKTIKKTVLPVQILISSNGKLAINRNYTNAPHTIDTTQQDSQRDYR